MKKLIDASEDILWRGAVLRFPASYPFEDAVDFMLFDRVSSERDFSLICTSGYKTGLFAGKLPNEARGKVSAISIRCLIKNWDKWVFPVNDIKNIYFIENYPEPEKINA